jgi:hypothetical protein
MLAEQEGVKQWNDGVAPFITPQFRTEVFGYEHVPPEIEVPAAAESWTSGAGYDLGAIGGGASISSYYNYSRGVDLSYEDRLFLSPKLIECDRSSGNPGLGGTPSKFFFSSYGLLVLAALDPGTGTVFSFIYRFDLTSQTWVTVVAETSNAFTDIVELDGTLYACRGDETYLYSVNGITWLTPTTVDEVYADYLTVRGNSSSVAALWKIENNAISNTSDGKDGGVAWSGTDEVGHTSEDIRGLITVNNDIFAFKKQGVYVYDGLSSQDLWKTDYLTETNGRNPYMWVDNLVYVTYGDRLLQFNPFNSDLTPIFPTQSQDSVETRGEITAVGGNAHHLYIAVKNKAGNTYILKGRPGEGWHTVVYLGANDCDALIIVAPGVVHANNPALVVGYGAAAHYYILPRDNVHPDADSNCRFETSGFVVGPYINFGAKSFSKFLNRGSLLGDGISAGRPATLKYEVDRSGTEVTLVAATSTGITETDETDEVAFNQIRYILYLESGDDLSTPAVDSMALYATLNPRRKRIWRPVVALSDELATHAGAYPTYQPSADHLRDILFGAMTKRLVLTDDRANTFTVRLLDINATGKVGKTVGGKDHDAMGYQLTLVEIRTLSTNQTTGVYDEHAYDSEAVYG